MAVPSVNLLALLRPTEVTVRIAGHPFVLDANSASQWLGAIALDLEDLAGIMPGLVAEDDLEAMGELVDTHPDIEDRWRYGARTALGRAAGRDWWWALNLASKALKAWIYVNGILLRQGVDAKKMSFPDWLDACYTMLWQNADEEHQLKLDMELSMRPKGVVMTTSPAATRAMMAQFAAD